MEFTICMSVSSTSLVSLRQRVCLIYHCVSRAWLRAWNLVGVQSVCTECQWAEFRSDLVRKGQTTKEENWVSSNRQFLNSLHILTFLTLITALRYR